MFIVTEALNGSSSVRSATSTFRPSGAWIHLNPASYKHNVPSGTAFHLRSPASCFVDNEIMARVDSGHQQSCAVRDLSICRQRGYSALVMND